MARLRHPLVLHINSTIKETKNELVIETEPIFASLSNLLHDFSNISPVPYRLEKYDFEPIEVFFILFCVCVCVCALSDFS